MLWAWFTQPLATFQTKLVCEHRNHTSPLQTTKILHIFLILPSMNLPLHILLEKAAVKNVAYCDRVDCMSGVSHRRLIFTVPFSTVKYCPRVCSTAAAWASIRGCCCWVATIYISRSKETTSNWGWDHLLILYIFDSSFTAMLNILWSDCSWRRG